jgi:phage terminase large subunit-like protein
VKGATSRAPEVIEFAKSVGIKLMPWQMNALGDMLLVKDGNWVGKTIGLCVSRQNGKTELAKLRILAGIYIFGEKTIAMMSSNRNMAVTTFRQIHYLIQDTPALLGLWEKTYSTNGNERIRFKNGAEIIVVAATNEGARGLSVDFFFIDELRDIKPEAWDAALYTTQAKPASQILAVSNAGDKGSQILNQLREKGIEDKTPSLRWLEWSAHPSLKITDRKAWAQANPALGHTITAEILEHRIRTGEPNQVRTEMLTQWVDNLASPWPIGAWESCKVENMVFEAGASTFFAIDISPSRRHAALVGAQMDGDKVKLKCLQTWKSEASIDDLKMASEINEHIKRFRPKMLLFDRYTTAGVAARLAHTGVPVMEISGQLFASACDEMLAAMSHNRIAHGDEYELSESVNSCAMRTTDSGWRIVRRKSAGEVASAICSAMLIWYANKPQAVAAIYVN